MILSFRQGDDVVVVVTFNVIPNVCYYLFVFTCSNILLNSKFVIMEQNLFSIEHPFNCQSIVAERFFYLQSISLYVDFYCRRGINFADQKKLLLVHKRLEQLILLSY